MPKNTVSDPITDQEIAFAHLIMSGTMNDRRAAEASEPAPKLANDTLPPNLAGNQLSVANPFINPEKLNRPSAATDWVFDSVLDQANSLRLPFSREKGFSGRRR